ncbi:MAG: hypothetical protein M1822_004587 [Bathelium mastoideum]|nr:MAG: hypothetical protein M1822_004587 [Bathelium mastoideum]
MTDLRGLLDTIQLHYMIVNRDMHENVTFLFVPHSSLSKKDVAVPAIPTAEEVGVAFGKCLSTTEKRTSINGWDACGYIIIQTDLRVLIGLPLCRNNSLLEQL